MGLAALHVHVDFAYFQRAANWTIRFCCKSVFEISVVLLSKSQHLYFICMMASFSVITRNHMRRGKRKVYIFNDHVSHIFTSLF